MSSKTQDEVKRITRRSNEIPEYSRYVLIETDTHKITCDLLDFSPFGLGVLCDKVALPPELQQGSIVRISLNQGETLLTLRARLASIADVQQNENPRLRIGFEILPENVTILGMRRGKRFHIDPGASLKCLARDKASPGEELYFTIKDFSGGGILLETSARNKFIFPGGQLELEILLSSSESIFATVAIRHIQSHESIYSIGCAFLNLSETSLEKIVSFYLSHSPTAEVNQRREDVNIVFQDLEIQVSQNPEEVLQIIGLRNDKHRSASTDLAAKDPWRNWSDNDLRSHHLMVKYKSRVVASARLLILGKDPSHTKGVDHRCIELSQIAIDSDYKDTPAYLTLWIGIFRFFIKHKIPSLIWRQNTSSSYSALPKKLGILPPVDKYNPKILPLNEIVFGTNSHFITWACIVAPQIEEDEVYRYRLGPLKSIGAKIARRLFLKEYVTRNHLEYQLSER